MVSLEQLSTDLLAAIAVSTGVIVLVSAIGLLAGWGWVAVSDLLFVLAALLFVLGAVMTRPTVSRRRAIQRATEDDDTEESPTTHQDGSERQSTARNPGLQLEWGFRIVLVAVVLFSVSFLIYSI